MGGQTKPRCGFTSYKSRKERPQLAPIQPPTVASTWSFPSSGGCRDAAHLASKVFKTGVPSPQIETPASHRRSIPAPPPHVAEKLVSLIRTIKPPLAGLLVVLAQLSVCLCCRPSWSNLSVPSVLGWRLFEIPAGCRPPLAFLPSCPSRSRAVVLIPRSSRPSLGKSRKGRRRRRQKRLKNRGTDSPFLHV